jgi:hypothetical protein
MKQFVMTFAFCMLLAQPTAAALYLCKTLHAYELEDGAFQTPSYESTEKSTWEGVLFDSDTGAFKYGNERIGFVEERMTVTAHGGGGMSASGHYMHNGTVFSAIVIYGWGAPPDFMLVHGGNSAVLTGTCTVYGE